MTKEIQLSDALYKQLEHFAEKSGDTLEMAISNLLNKPKPTDVVGVSKKKKPTIKFLPDNDEEKFIEKLLQFKKAKVVLRKRDGSEDVREWNIRRFTAKSKLKANLWSGYLRDWEEKGIVAAELSVVCGDK